MNRERMKINRHRPYEQIMKNIIAPCISVKELEMLFRSNRSISGVMRDDF